MKQERHLDVLTRLLELDGKSVADIGCGDGSLCRRLAEAGAQMTGVEISPDKVEGASANDAEGLCSYVEAFAQNLPFDAGSLDGVVFFNSLHHVPVEVMDGALAEVDRVLKAKGFLCVAEPVAEGANFEMMKPVHDETIVRAEAQAALDRVSPAYSAHQEERYISLSRYQDAEKVLSKLLTVDPERAAIVSEKGDDLREAFGRLGQPGPKGMTFEQPMLVRLFTKA